MHMRFQAAFLTRLVITLLAVATLAGPQAFAKEPSAALQLARQLNQAFIEVADEVSPAVVVVRVAQKAGLADEEEEDSLAPFLEKMPRDLRRWFEERRDRQRHASSSLARARRRVPSAGSRRGGHHPSL